MPTSPLKVFQPPLPSLEDWVDRHGLAATASHKQIRPLEQKFSFASERGARWLVNLIFNRYQTEMADLGQAFHKVTLTWTRRGHKLMFTRTGRGYKKEVAFFLMPNGPSDIKHLRTAVHNQEIHFRPSKYT